MNSYVSIPISKMLGNTHMNVRVTGVRTMIVRLKLMKVLFAIAALVGGVKDIDVDISYRD